MVLAIVVTFNASKWLDRCFSSLLSSTTPVSVIAVDNGSSDGTPDIIRQKYHSVEVIETGENLGFGKANNIGLKRALEGNFDYAFLLNQDAWINRDTIVKLVSIHQKNRYFGILSPLHLSGDERNLDNAFTRYINAYSCPGLISDYILRRDIKEVYEISFVNAAFWLISRACIEKVGGFDPLFFMYGEDDDYIRRVIRHGLKMGICPYSLGYHDRPQILNDTNKCTVEIMFSSKLIELKDPDKSLPLKKSFYKTLFKLKLKALLYGKDLDKQIQINKRIIYQYNKIKIHRDQEKLLTPNFLIQ